jgi:hypothetical protein
MGLGRAAAPSSDGVDKVFVPWLVVLLAVAPVLIAVALVLLLRTRQDATLQEASEALATVISALKGRSSDRPSV